MSAAYILTVNGVHTGPFATYDEAQAYRRKKNYTVYSISLLEAPE